MSFLPKRVIQLRGWALLLAVSLVIGVGRESHAADRPGAAANLPDWLHEGTVISSSWYSQVTTEMYKEDKQGNIMDPNTGRVFTPVDRRGTSGHGWSQLTVTSIDAENATVSINLFQDAKYAGIVDPVADVEGLSLMVAAEGKSAGDSWFTSAKLAALQSDVAHGLLVTRCVWKSGNETYDAVRIELEKDGNYGAYVYDTKTGLELHYFESLRNVEGQVVGPLKFGQENTRVSIGDFISVRDTHLPWAGEAMSDAVWQMRAIHFAGQTQFPMTGAPPVPISRDKTVLSRGKGWIQVEDSFSTAGTVPTRTKQFFGATQLGGLWAGPAALAKLQKGQLLDEDPVTKIRAVVSGVDDKVVLITRSNSDSRIVDAYDKRSGLLVASNGRNVIGKSEQVLKLRGAE